jgi:hypothetical protein
MTSAPVLCKANVIFAKMVCNPELNILGADAAMAFSPMIVKRISICSKPGGAGFQANVVTPMRRARQCGAARQDAIGIYRQ